MSITLRPYQREILNDPVIVAILHSLIGKVARPDLTAPLVVSPTGSGKTAMFAAIAKWCREHNLRVLILTHRREILEQTLKALYKLGIVAGQIIAGRPMTGDLIQVASVQTLGNRLGTIWRPDLILSDEAHHDTLENNRGRILQFFGSVPRIGWTATPARLDGVGLRPVYDAMIEGKTTRWLVDEGYLTMPLVYQPPGMVTETYHVVRGDLDAKEQEAVMSRRAVIGNVIDHYKKYLNGAPTIVSCVSIDHARLMAEQYELAGFRSRVVWGNMKTDDRIDALEGLGTGKYNVVTFADLIGEGVDIPVVTGLQMLRRTQSLVLDLQFIGRVLRPIYRPGADLSTAEARKEAIATGGKPFAIVLDHVGNTTPEMHGHPLADRVWSLDSQKRPKGEKAPATTTCPKCYGVWPGRPRSCPSCGHSFVLAEAEAKRQELVEIEGELVQAGLEPDDAGGLAAMIARAKALTGADKQRMILGQAFALMTSREDEETRKRKVAALAKAVGYKEGWTRMVWELKVKRERAGAR